MQCAAGICGNNAMKNAIAAGVGGARDGQKGVITRGGERESEREEERGRKRERDGERNIQNCTCNSS